MSEPTPHLSVSMPGSWRIRRAFMFVTMAFCMGTIVYCLWKGTDSEVAQTAVSMAFVIIGTTVASYVFGAAWQDISQPFNMRNEREPYYGSYYERSSVYGVPVDDPEDGG